MIVLVTLAVAGMVHEALAAGVNPPPGFASSFEKALAEAKKDNKPLYVHFTTDWCGWCRRIEKEVYASEKGKEALSGFVAVSLDCSEKAPDVKTNEALLDKYGGGGYPFIVILAPDGTVLDSFSYMAVDEFVKRVNGVREKFERRNKFLEKAKAGDHPNDLAFQLEALEVFASTQEWDKVDAAARRVLTLDKERAHTVKAKFAQLQVAAAQKNARTLDNLVLEIRRLDPDNKGHSLEAALEHQAELAMDKVTTKTFEVQYKRAHTILVQRAALKNLRDPLSAKVDLGIFQAKWGKFNDARTTLQKLLTDNPNHPSAASIKNLIEQINKIEAQTKK